MRPRLALGAAAGVASRGPHLDHAANLITRTREDPKNNRPRDHRSDNPTGFGLAQGLINWRPQQLSGTGKVVVKQSDFGIEPVSAAGRLVQVEDDVTVTFRIVAGREERELPQIRTGLFRSFHSELNPQRSWRELARAHARRHGWARSESWCDGSSASAV